MEPLSSFAINFALGVALDLWKSQNNKLDKQIMSAFSAALKDWSKNESIRNRNQRGLKSILKDYIINSEGTINNETDKNITTFFDHFEKRIAVEQIAFNYLLSINNKNRYDGITNRLSTMDEKLSSLMESTNIDAREVGKLLNELPFDKGKEEVENTIQALYDKEYIKSLGIKEILIVGVQKVFERTDELSKEIKYLKSKGKTYLAETLEKIIIAIEQREPDSLLKIYKNYINREKENKISLLNELIQSSITIFAYNETIKFYSELIDLEPSAENHFDLARYLQRFNFYNEAFMEYEEVLQIYRELLKENPQMYLPHIAKILNNMAVLHSDKNEFPQALEKYEEALQINRELIKKNPRTHLPELARSLNNMATLQMDKNEYPQALEKYEEALLIRRKLAKENSQKYLRYLATTLNNLGVFYTDKNEFPQALEKYEETLQIYRELLKENPQKYLFHISRTLNNMAILLKDNNEFPQALEKYEEALLIRKKLAKENPRTHLPDLAATLNSMAVLHRAKNEFPQALEKYEEALLIRRKLAKENPQIYLPFVARTLNNLGNLQTDKMEFPKALEKLEEALKIYRELAKENSQKYLPLVAITLNNLAKNEFPQALERYEEGLKIFRELAKENPTTYEIDYARMLIMGVTIFNKNGNNLKEARRILKIYPGVYQAQRLLGIMDNLERKK